PTGRTVARRNCNSAAQLDTAARSGRIRRIRSSARPGPRMKFNELVRNKLKIQSSKFKKSSSLKAPKSGGPRGLIREGARTALFADILPWRLLGIGIRELFLSFRL